MVVEEGEDAVGYAEDGGDEEDEDVVGDEDVGVEVLTQEVGEHA